MSLFHFAPPHNWGIAKQTLLYWLCFLLPSLALASDIVTHEMALEGFLGIHFLLSEWDPVVGALYSLYVVIEQCIGKAVALKLQVGLPSIIRIQELVSALSQVASIEWQTAM